MKKEYDFSKGERGKFYRPDAELNTPVYLEPQVAEATREQVRRRGQTMSKDYHVVPSGDGWAVRREGSDRAGSVHDTQREAIEVGRGRAIRDRGELVIHDRHGRIRDKDSYGRDPNPPKDRKH